MSNKKTEYTLQYLKNLSADHSVSPPIPREGVLGIDSDGNYRNLLCNSSGEVIIDTTNLDTVYLKLDQTTPQTVSNGIPKLDAQVSDFNDLDQFVNKRYVDLSLIHI